MKRILSFVLILVMVLGLLAGCGAKPVEPTAGASVEDAKTYLYAMYKEDNGTIARRDFKMVSVVMIDGVSFPIEWTTDSADYVTIGAPENNMVTVDIVEDPTEQVTFKLIATLKDAAGNTASVEITRVIEAVAASGVEFAATPVAGTAYKFAVVQNNLGETIYFTGEMSGYYLATSANPFDAVDVFVEDVDGGQRLYFMSGDVKTYIDVVPRGEDNPGKVNVVLTETPTCVYTWDSERKTFVTNTVADNTWYLGCYNTYNTVSASNISYIEDVTKIGDSQFPAGLCTVNIVASQVSAPVADTAYKFAVMQNNLGQTIYFTGEMSGYYLATSANPAEGVNVFVENTDGGVHLYFMKGDVKTYIDVVPRGEDNPGKVNVVLTEAPTCVYTWDSERKTFITNTVADNTWYLGCYNTYNTMSASNISYIEDVTKIGESQFPAGPYTVDGFMDMQPTFEAETPVDPDPTPSTEPEKPVNNDPAANSKLSIADAIALGASKEHNTYTEGKYYVTGVITEVTSSQYGNMKITDDKGNVLTIYGTFSADGTLRYDAMGTLPVAGDTVTIYGIIGQYNGTPQLKNGWITAHTPVAPVTPDPEPSKDPEPSVSPDPEPSKDPEPSVEPEKVGFVDAPVVGNTYKFAMNQANLGKVLYFTGEMDGYYLAMSENVADGVDVTVESVDGGIRVYFMNKGVKTYIDIVPRDNDKSKTNVILTQNPSAVFTWDSARTALIATVNGTDWYLGTYNTFKTISTSKTSYIEDVSKIGVSQFVAGFYNPGN